MEDTGSGADQWYPYDPHCEAEIIPMSLFAGVILLSTGVAGVLKIGTSMLGLLGFLREPYQLTPYWRNFFLIGYPPFLLMCVGFIYAAIRFLHKYVFRWRALTRESGFLVTDDYLLWRSPRRSARVPWNSIVGLRVPEPRSKCYSLRHREGLIPIPTSVQGCEEIITIIGDRSPNLAWEQGLTAGRALRLRPSGAAGAIDRVGAARGRRWDRERAAFGCLNGQAVGGFAAAIGCGVAPAFGWTLPTFPGLVVMLPCWALGGIIGLVAGGYWEPQPRWVRLVGRSLAAGLVLLWLWMIISGIASGRHPSPLPRALTRSGADGRRV